MKGRKLQIIEEIDNSACFFKLLSTDFPVGNEQILETNFIAYQGEHDVKNRKKQVYNASPPERARKIRDEEHVGV